MNSTPSQLRMHYGACPKKLEARSQTIMATYRNRYGRQSIPRGSQYWSICGRCSYEPGRLEENCEPDQLSKAGLIRPDQFYGVEIDQEIYGFNQSSDSRMHWFRGDFYSTMVEYSNGHPFRPAVVNVDMLLMPRCGAEYFSKIMHFLTDFRNDIMLVGNFVMAAHTHVAATRDIVRCLEGEACYQDCGGAWKMHRRVYRYNGTGNSRTKMGTVIFFKG